MSRDVFDCKVVLLGKDWGGKTSLVERFLHDRFTGMPYRNTIGTAFGAKRLQANGRWIALGIWDTAGSEKHQAMTRIYYRGARAAIVCYDLTDSTSFEKARFWVNELQEAEENCKIYLCGTKLDLIEMNEQPRAVDYHDNAYYGTQIGAEVFETSSKLNRSVRELFQKIADDYIPELDISGGDNMNFSNSGLDISQKGDSEKRRKCCFSS